MAHAPPECDAPAAKRRSTRTDDLEAKQAVTAKREFEEQAFKALFEYATHVVKKLQPIEQEYGAIQSCPEEALGKVAYPKLYEDTKGLAEAADGVLEVLCPSLLQTDENETRRMILAGDHDKSDKRCFLTKVPSPDNPSDVVFVARKGRKLDGLLAETKKVLRQLSVNGKLAYDPIKLADHEGSNFWIHLRDARNKAFAVRHLLWERRGGMFPTVTSFQWTIKGLGE